MGMATLGTLGHSNKQHQSKKIHTPAPVRGNRADEVQPAHSIAMNRNTQNTMRRKKRATRSRISTSGGN